MANIDIPSFLNWERLGGHHDRLIETDISAFHFKEGLYDILRNMKMTLPSMAERVYRSDTILKVPLRSTTCSGKLNASSILVKTCSLFPD
jgi:transcriptional regulator of acetoin/glycerol metabolism